MSVFVNISREKANAGMILGQSSASDSSQEKGSTRANISTLMNQKRKSTGDHASNYDNLDGRNLLGKVHVYRSRHNPVIPSVNPIASVVRCSPTYIVDHAAK